MPLYFWPLAKLQSNYCFRRKSCRPCLENKTLLWGWMCSWVGINGFYGFLALWHVYFLFFIFFSFLHPASVEQALACKQLLPAASIYSSCFQLSPAKDFFFLTGLIKCHPKHAWNPSGASARECHYQEGGEKLFEMDNINTNQGQMLPKLCV